MANKYVVVDLETTGNSPKKGDKIIQIAAVVIEDGKIGEVFTSLVNPQTPIPAFIAELTGLSDEDVAEAPLFSEIARKVSSLLEDSYFVAHNVLFDLGFLQDELLMVGEEGFYGPVLDTVEMARFIDPGADSYKLADLAEKEGLSHERPHQADSDALVTAELFLLFLKRMECLPERTLRHLASLSEGLKSDLHLILDEMADKASSGNYELPESIIMVNGIGLKRIIKDEEAAVQKPAIPYPYHEEEKRDLLINSFRQFEYRTGQFNMMDEVFHSFSNRSHALIEAGTGIGKSLGYLLPAAFFSVQQNERIVISTYTIQLQEQLLTKEIPILAAAVPFPVKAALFKGRGNYISLRKFAKSLEEENDNYDTALAKMQILVWLTRTEQGDRDELNLSSGGLLYWNSIQNDPGTSNAGWEEFDFYKRAREKAYEADLLITNHALLLADLEAGGTILPPYDYAVLDEGHQFEHAAAMHFGFRLDYLGTRLAIGQFGLYEQRQLFYKAERAISSKFRPGQAPVDKVKLSHLISDVVYEMDGFFKLSISFASKAAKKSSSKKLKTILKPEKNNKEWNALKHSAERFSFLLKDLHVEAAGLARLLQSMNSKESAAIHTDLAAFLSEIDEIRNRISEIFSGSTGYVKWVETDIRAPQNTTELAARPLSLAKEISGSFFSGKKSVVLTSGTLTVNKSFDYITGELGLDPLLVNMVEIPSPFDYGRNVKLFISKDLPEINSVSQDEYVAEIASRIISVCEAAKGRLLVLFTSHDMLKKTYELVKESGLLEEYALIAQGISGGSRSRLTRNFQKYEKAVLFGTNSFWEGIDIPGEGLSCLIVVRLPFSSPDEPLTKAKCELIEKRGGKPFSEFSLPEAVLRFKQGFGRLIRTESDKGIIVVFDRRLGESSYGRTFLQSIPHVPVRKIDIDELVEEIEAFL